MFPWTLPLLITLTSLGWCQAESVCSYYDLLQNLDLKNSSNEKARPVRDWRTQSVVWINLYLYTIIELDTSLQSLTSFVWFYMSWENEFATWNPDAFCGIQKMSLSSEYFWKPDLYVDEMTEDGNKSPQIPYYVLDHNGTIFNSMPLRIVSSCNMDIFKFPFDTQICSLSFGSYVYPVDDLIMMPRANSTKVTEYSRKIFASKGDWSLVGISVQNQTYETEGDWYNQVIYKIMIKRAPVVYVINLIVPACLMVLLDIFSMFIQIGTGERLGFKITIILGFSVLLLILNNLLPNSDSPPVLGIFCCVCLAVMVFSIIGSIVISYMLSLSDTQPNVPPWIRIWILRHLARVLCFRSKPMQEDYVTAVDNAVSKSSEDIKKAESQKELQEQRKDTPRNTKGRMEVKLLKMLLVEVLKIHQDLANTKNESDAKSDWHHAALVVDRLILIVYLFTVVIIFAIVVIVWTS